MIQLHPLRFGVPLFQLVGGFKNDERYINFMVRGFKVGKGVQIEKASFAVVK